MRQLLLVLAATFVVGSDAADARRLRNRLACEDGGGWVAANRGGPIGPGTDRVQCDADARPDGACTLVSECRLGIPCPPCCTETLRVPVRMTVRLPPWGFSYRFRCRRSAPGPTSFP